MNHANETKLADNSARLFDMEMKLRKTTLGCVTFMRVILQVNSEDIQSVVDCSCLDLT